MKYTPNSELAKKLNVWAWILSVVVIAAVVLMQQFKIPVDTDLSFLAPFHSAVNAITGVVLIYAYIQIRKKNVIQHKQAIILAMLLSLVFLLSYVTYHLTQEEVHFCKEGAIKYIYFALLITHVVSAGIIFPFVLFTFVRGYTYMVEKHRRMARWVFPIWLYVCFSGPVVYLLLASCF